MIHNVFGRRSVRTAAGAALAGLEFGIEAEKELRRSGETSHHGYTSKQ
jgi:hypothetical protein